MKLPAAPVAPVSTTGLVPRTLCILCASALLDMLEDSVSWTTTSVLPALATRGQCARMNTMAAPACVALDIKPGIVAWKWVNVSQILAEMRLRASTRSEDTLVFVPDIVWKV